MSNGTERVVRELPPRGHYLAYEVGRLAGVSGHTIGQWKRNGYIRASQDARAYPNVYSYQDVAEAMVVHELIAHGVELSDVKGLIRVLRDEFGTSWPLARADIYVSRAHGAPQLVVGDQDTHFDVTEHRYPWQAVITLANLERIARDLNRGGWAARHMPDLRFIEVNPLRLSGRPVIRGTRVPAEKVAEAVTSTWPPSIVAEEFDITVDQVADAVRWWKTVRAYESNAA